MPGRGEKCSKRKWYLKGGGGGGKCVSNFVCLKIIVEYPYREIQSEAMTAFWKEMLYLHAL